MNYDGGMIRQGLEKPRAVRQVEALGWLYEAIGVLLVAWLVVDSIIDGDIVGAVELLLSGLFALALPVGMVLALRRGRRAWFLVPHILFVFFPGLLFFLVALQEFFGESSSMMNLFFVVLATVVLILAAIAIPLLFRADSSRWFYEKSGDGRPDRGGCLLPIIIILLFIFSPWLHHGLIWLHHGLIWILT